MAEPGFQLFEDSKAGELVQGPREPLLVAGHRVDLPLAVSIAELSAGLAVIRLSSGKLTAEPVEIAIARPPPPPEGPEGTELPLPPQAIQVAMRVPPMTVRK